MTIQMINKINKEYFFFDIYKTFKKENFDYYEIERNEENYRKIWTYSNKYIFEIIREIIEKYSDIDSLAQNLSKTRNETLDYLNKFYKFSTKGRIFINQNDKFCEITSLFNDNNLIPDILKNISKNLGWDLREKLILNMGVNVSMEKLSLEKVCSTIDKMMEKKYQDPNNYSKTEFRKAAEELINEYFEEIGENDIKTYFPLIFFKKEEITYNVIFDRETRKGLTKLNNNYGSNAITKLNDNPNVVKKIMSGKLSDDSNLLILGSHYTEREIETLLNNPESIRKIIDGEFSDNTNNSGLVSHGCSYSSPSTISEGENSISIAFNTNISQSERNLYNYALRILIDFISSPNKRTGIIGEIYIYELLKNSNQFRNVTWKMLSPTGIGESFYYNNETYIIIDDGSHYDIEVETMDGRTIYVEVKSTKYNCDNKIPFYISQQQIEWMELTHYPNEYILAIVFNALSEPKGFFLTLNRSFNNLII